MTYAGGVGALLLQEGYDEILDVFAAERSHVAGDAATLEMGGKRVG